MTSDRSFQNNKRWHPNEIRETRSSTTFTCFPVHDDDVDDARSTSPPSSLHHSLTSFSDDESIFKGQKYFRLKDLLESSSLECLRDDDQETDEVTPSSSLSSSQGSRYGYDTHDEDLLFENDFNTTLNLHETATQNFIPFSIWGPYLPSEVPEFGVVRFTTVKNHRVQAIQSQKNFVEEPLILCKQKSPIPRGSSPLSK